MAIIPCAMQYILVAYYNTVLLTIVTMLYIPFHDWLILQLEFFPFDYLHSFCPPPATPVFGNHYSVFCICKPPPLLFFKVLHISEIIDNVRDHV